MAEENGGGGFPWAPLLALLTAGSGIFLLMPTLGSFRPSGGSSRTISRDGYVKARLWQDPLETVREAASHESPTASDDGVHNLRAQIQEKVFRQPATTSATDTFPWTKDDRDQFLILPVMVSAGPYEENVERRLRDRHAVLDGLHAAGFVPEENEMLGFFRFPGGDFSAGKMMTASLGSSDKSQSGPTAQWLLPAHPCSCGGKEPLIAFEWCHRLPCVRLPGNVPWEHILVLWVPEDDFETQPLHQLADLFSLLAYRAPDGQDGHLLDLPEIHLLGPENSGTLHSVMGEVVPSPKSGQVFEPAVRVALASTHIFACEPSASDTQLKDGFDLPFEKTCKQLIEETVQFAPNQNPLHLAHRFAFDRTVLPDDRIVKTMREELLRRRVQLGQSSDQIAIISELDTFYSQALQNAFSMYENRTATTSKSDDDLDRATIHFYSYLRGIDGQLPGNSGDKKQKDGEDQSSDDSKDDTPAQRRKKIADTAGLDQSDYLQRLADELGSLDDRLWNRGRGGLKAVGVLGSDVYDKLEILAALRPKLPGVVFFTNFLDAHLSHPDSWAATHNLLVVSSYGLKLNARYQHGTLPFRDSFQTGVFEATQEAVGTLPVASIQSETPRIYEIGRSGPWDLSVGSPSHSSLFPARQDLDRVNFWSRPPQGLTKPWENPRPFPLSRARVTCILVAAAVLFLILLARLSRTKCQTSTRRRLTRPFAILLTNTGIFVPVAGFASAFFVWHLYAGQFEFGEPFAWFEGISVCPSDILRLFAALLCIHFIIKAHFKLKSNALQLCEEFGLVPLRVDWLQIIRLRQWKTLRLFLLGAPTLWSHQSKGKVTNVAAFWWDYQRRGLLPLRFVRTVLLALVFMAFTFPMVILIGHMPPPFPIRGPLISFEYLTIWVGVTFSVLLTFFVIDATRLHTDFIDRCARYTSRWPDRTFEKFGYGKPSAPVIPGVPAKPKPALFGESNIADFWDILLIAKRTDAVNILVYYPFIFILLMMLSRIDYFDNWTWPIALVVVMALQGGLLLYHCCKLPTKARRYREKILARLRRRYRLAVAAGKDNRAKAIETIISEVEDKLRQGAFVSLWEQPVFRAILLPSGGVGIWTLIQYLPH